MSVCVELYHRGLWVTHRSKQLNSACPQGWVYLRRLERRLHILTLSACLPPQPRPAVVAPLSTLLSWLWSLELLRTPVIHLTHQEIHMVFQFWVWLNSWILLLYVNNIFIIREGSIKSALGPAHQVCILTNYLFINGQIMIIIASFWTLVWMTEPNSKV